MASSPRSSSISKLICSNSSSLRAFTRTRDDTAALLFVLRSGGVGGHPCECGDRPERGDVECRDRRDSHHCCVGPEHPRGNLQIASIDPTNGHGAVVASRLADDLEGPAGERVKRVVDDDRRTMGVMSYFGSTRICT